LNNWIKSKLFWYIAVPVVVSLGVGILLIIIQYKAFPPNKEDNTPQPAKPDSVKSYLKDQAAKGTKEFVASKRSSSKDSNKPQSTISELLITGNVLNKENFEPIPRAEVSVIGRTVHVYTDNMGYFSVMLKTTNRSTLEIKIEAANFRPYFENIEINAASEIVRKILLEPN